MIRPTPFAAIILAAGKGTRMKSETMARMLERIHGEQRPAAVVVGFRPEDPLQYGRILASPDGTIEKMVEYKDATPEERAVDLCNSGLLAARASELFALLKRV